MSKVVLGKGLGALIPGDEKKQAQGNYQTVPLEKIAPNPMQPRHKFDEDALTQLAASIKQDGLMQPLVVQKNGEGFTIVAGERRFRAAKLAGLVEVPVLLLKDLSDTRMLELALIENLQREDLNPMETAEAYHRLMTEFSMTQQQLAEKVGKSRAAVANTVRLTGLPSQVKQMVRDGALSEGHARAILSLDNEDAMLKMARDIVDNVLSVRQIEKVSSGKKRRRLIPKKQPTLVEMENYLKRLLGTSVRINHGLKRGKIEIEYYSDDDLERLLDLMRKIEQ